MDMNAVPTGTLGRFPDFCEIKAVAAMTPFETELQLPSWGGGDQPHSQHSHRGLADSLRHLILRKSQPLRLPSSQFKFIHLTH
jgi:hypothetical protein